MNYFKKCEELFQNWSQSKLEMNERIFEALVVPEPYLLFGSGEKPLYLLLTNPGTGMPEIQSHDAVKKFGVKTYEALAHRLEKLIDGLN
jgi:hypothetical protein